MVKPRLFLLTVLVLAILFAFSQDAFANPSLIVRGVGRTLFSVFEIPRSIIQQSSSVMFPLSIVTGTVTGSFRMIMGTLGGALDIAQGAAPYAKYAILFV